VLYTSGSGSDFSAQAEWQFNRLVKFEGSKSKVHKFKINSVATFKNSWNGMGTVAGKKVKINTVVIYCHGNYRAIILQNGSSTNALSINGKNSAGKTIGDIRDLKRKKIIDVQLLTCNGGNLIIYFKQKKNLASVLSKKVQDGVVHAYDGNVSFGKPFWDIFGKDIGYSSRLATNQNDFNEILRKYEIQDREPMGKVVYYNGVYYPYGYYPNTSIR
jgi:hypothetical protein